MSAQSVETVLSKAMSDANFADALFDDPEKVLAGYDLTKEENANLKAMSRADFDAYVKASPEERKSMGTINHNQSALSIH